MNAKSGKKTEKKKQTKNSWLMKVRFLPNAINKTHINIKFTDKVY